MSKGIVALVALLWAGVAMAGFEVPRHVFTKEAQEEAFAKAKSAGKPLAFVLSDAKTTCPLCVGATNRMFEEMKSSAVLVLIQDRDEAPAIAKDAFREGKYIPKMVVVDPALSKVVGNVTYEAVKASGDDAFKDVKKAIRELKKGG